MNTFAKLGLPGQLVHVLDRQDITSPFPIQEATIPPALEGHDVSGKAPTGSGKTLAFGLPVLTRVEPGRPRRPRALVLAPTRELAEQIKSHLAPLAKAVGARIVAIYGGVSYGPQRKAMNSGVEVLVATPGRLEDLIEQRTVSLEDVDIVVVDEADRMADMGFLPAVKRILDQTSNQRQTLLFSATLDGDIATLVKRYQRDPFRYETEGTEDAPEVKHHFWMVEHTDRVEHVAKVVDAMGQSIVFTRTRRGADRLARQLDKAGVRAVALHGGRSQNQRQRALKSFTSGRATALVATDVAARGIHIDNVEAVVHFDLTDDHKDFLHRSGRTGRAGAEGTVVSLVTHQTKRSVKQLQRSLSISAPLTSPQLGDLRRSGGPATNSKPKQRPHQSGERGSTNLFVGNLAWSLTPDELRKAFSHHVDVKRAEIASHKGKSKGYGFVEVSAGSASDVIGAMNHQLVKGRKLKVREARERSKN